jgi:hypothetical protein
MIHIKFFFKHNIFKRKKSDSMVRISPCNQRVKGLIFYSIFFFFHEQIGSISFNGQLFQARCLEKKRIFFKEEKKW